ncbi:hypothetical protein Ppa06_70190 [Planomonospora parontospora subsp. parontospora]|uniref:Helix-turn-helix domain-containing protein n=2 Tax=Planomonospora parontospora TaxID=58119 RepID=A0AA37F8G1_9ACTN|nr:helix-turn-helix domain-containing protein [Planomonospora parontospora]GGL01422.1 hypothetical protein GCM10010126_70840 [Planomonospora parontospora]GII13221.1 hypothetical protein Ppa06_70190 [Planomonospora parontospora subsp. parontospora]
MTVLLPDRATMSVTETAAVLGVHRDAAYAAAGRGQIPHLRIGRLIRVPTAALAALPGLPGPAAAPAELPVVPVAEGRE